MFLWPASWVNISHAGGRSSRSISVPTSGNTFLSPQHLESEKCKRNLESTNLRWRKFPKRCLYLGHTLDSSTRMGCSKIVIPSYPSALWWCPVAWRNSSNSNLRHGEQGDLEAMGPAVFPSRTWAAHHLETTCFRCTDFNKNTQYPQCQYLLPDCGAQPEAGENHTPSAKKQTALSGTTIQSVFAKKSPLHCWTNWPLTEKLLQFQLLSKWPLRQLPSIQFLNKLVLARQHRLLQTVLVEKAENKLHNPVSAQGCFKRLPHT